MNHCCRLNPNATLPESQTESTSQAAADADQKASGASETHNGTSMYRKYFGVELTVLSMNFCHFSHSAHCRTG